MQDIQIKNPTESLWNILKEYERPFVTVLNKLDKLKTQKRKSWAKKFSENLRKTLE